MEPAILKNFLYFAKAGFMGQQPMQSPRAMSSEGPCTHLMLCVTILKLLIILSLRLCFVSEVWLDTWAWAHKHHLLPFPTATLAYCIHSGPWGPNGWVQGKKLYLQHSKQERWRPWEFMLSIPTRTCFQCRKKAMMFWETQPRDSLTSFLMLVFLLPVSPGLILKMMT